MDKCAPIAEDHYKRHNTCFDVAALERLRDAWNAGGGKPIAGGLGLAALRRELKQRLSGTCGEGADAEVCWVTTLGVRDGVVKRRMRTEMPKDWVAKPKKWLSNFDIEDVMRQYEETPAFRFAFLGVLPVDFGVSDGAGSCWVPKMCELKLKDLVAAGKRAAGAIINLDKHDEPGSHWVSMFAVLDASLPSYGAYYYDSIGVKWPASVLAYMKGWEAQMKALRPPKPFPLRFNTVQHQRENTECGMFSMFHQLLWIERLKEDAAKVRTAAKAAKAIKDKGFQHLVEDNAPTTFDMIVNIPLRDEHVWRLRKMLYMAGGGRRRRK